MAYGFVIDLEKCVGCHGCSVACKGANGTPPTVTRSRVDRGTEGSYPNAVRTIGISAGTGAGLKELQEVLEEQLRNSRIQVEKLFPYAQAGDIQRIRRYGQVLEEEYREDGIYIKAWMPRNY